LEALARRNEKENSEIFDLHKKIERFEHEKQQRLRDKENLERVCLIQYLIENK
jgi:flagellar assembly factor FliW